MSPTYSVIARIYGPTGDKLTALVERRDFAQSARARAAALNRSTKPGDRKTWPDAVTMAVDNAPEFANFGTIDRIEYEQVTT